MIFRQLPSVPDPGASIHSLPKKRPILPPSPPVKKRKLILPDPDYVSSGIPAPLASEVDSLFEEPVNGDTDGDAENGIFPMKANPSSANPVNLPTYSSDSICWHPLDK